MSSSLYASICLVFISFFIVQPVKAETCVLPKEQMTSEHMYVLKTWRDDVLRNGDRSIIEIDGKSYKKSLDQTCMDCHSKIPFCDNCHTVNAVSPNCWDCHSAPDD